jgi:hypothetical protein
MTEVNEEMALAENSLHPEEKKELKEEILSTEDNEDFKVPLKIPSATENVLTKRPKEEAPPFSYQEPQWARPIPAAGEDGTTPVDYYIEAIKEG